VSCQEPVKCRYCDATMTYHRSTGQHVASGSHAAVSDSRQTTSVRFTIHAPFDTAS